MIYLFKSLLLLHIAGGTVGLISGTIAASVHKGTPGHKLSGKFFFWGMLVASIAALLLSNLPDHHNIFLFAVGGFTFYMISSGYRIVFLKRKGMKSFSIIDYTIFLFGAGFGVFLLYMGIYNIINGNNFGMVPCVFGFVCIGFAKNDYIMIFRNVPVKEIWIHSHIVRMMGAMIASYTAVLVVNVKMEPNWVLWLAPTLVGTFLITFFIRKYAPKAPKLPS